LSTLETFINLLQNLVLNLASKSELFGGFTDGARGQIEVDLVDDLTKMTLHVRDNDRLGKLLSVSLVSTIVFDLDVQVQRAFATVNFLAVLVWADVRPVDLPSCASVVLFASKFLCIRQTHAVFD